MSTWESEATRKLYSKIDSTLDEKRAIVILPTNKLTPPAVGIFDEPYRCYKINKQWAKYVMGMVSLLTDPKMWKDVHEPDAFPMTEIIKFLLGSYCDMPLRQNPDNSCQLQQSLDEGVTWVTVFDFSLCLQSSGSLSDAEVLSTVYSTEYQPFVENVYNYVNNNYVNNITDVYPDLGYDMTADDLNRDNGLCFTIGESIDKVCEAAIAYLDEMQDKAEDLRLYTAIATGVLAVTAIATGGTSLALAGFASQAAAWGAGIALGASLGGALVDTIVEGNRAYYTDQTAKDEVQCCLYQQWDGANLNESVFNSPVSCAEFSTAAQAIFNAFAALAQERAMYAAFASRLDINYNAAKLGLLPECPCDDWCIVFSGADLGTYLTTSPDGAGSFDGTKWNAGIVPDVENGLWSRATYIYLDLLTIANVRHVEFVYDLSKGSLTPGIWRGVSITDVDNAADILFIGFHTLVNGNDQLASWYGDQVTQNLSFYVRASKEATSNPSGIATIKEIRISGKGAKPSIGVDC